MDLLTAGVASVDDDPYSDENLREPYAMFRRWRESGDVVWLDHYDVHAFIGYETCRAILKDPENFISGAGVGPKNLHREAPWRPPGLLQTDPPAHTDMRRAMASVLSPRTARKLRQNFENYADELVKGLLERRSVDGMLDLAQPFPLRVMGDAVGIPREGRRENLLPQGAMNFSTFGPENERCEHFFRLGEPTTEWVMRSCRPENLAANGLGKELWSCADRGEITHDQAGRLVRATLTAGIDTTVLAIGNMLHALTMAPEQWEAVRADPKLVRFAVDEALRFDSPFQSFYRTTSVDLDFRGIHLPRGTKVLLFMGAANQDPDQWGDDADRFRVERDAGGHLAFGMGIHQCVGQPLARLEMEVLLGCLVRRVRRLEPAGAPIRFLHNTLRGYESLPLLVVPN